MKQCRPLLLAVLLDIRYAGGDLLFDQAYQVV